MDTIFLLEDNVGPKIIFRLDLEYHPEDFKNAHFSWARRYEDAIEIIKCSAPFDLWSLDHDLGDPDGTGLDFLKEIAERYPDKWPKTVRVHSNHSGHSFEMREFIKQFEESAEVARRLRGERTP